MQPRVLVVVVLLAVAFAGVDATARLKKQRSGMLARAEAAMEAGVAVTADMRRAGFTSMTQFNAEYRALQKLVAEGAKAGVRDSVAQSNKLLSENKEKDSILATIHNSMDAFVAKFGGNLATLPNNDKVILHSGTASRLYGIRPALTDVDGHYDTMKPAKGVADNLKNVANGHLELTKPEADALAKGGLKNGGTYVEVDMYDPPVDGAKEWAKTLAQVIRGGGVKAQVKDANGGVYHVVTLSQLLAEYTALQQDNVRQGNALKKASDAQTVAGLNGLGLKVGDYKQ